jgi:hypothetical protein
VAGIGQQSQGVGRDAVERFGSHIDEVQGGSESERVPEASRCMNMAAHPVRAPLVVISVAAIVVRVMV